MGAVRGVLLTFTLTVVAASNARADDVSHVSLSPIGLFNRCYSQLTGQILPRNHPLARKVSAGTMTAVAACMSVLDEAKLGAPGAPNEGMLVSNTPESQAVLRTLNDFHRQWFSAYSMADATPTFGCIAYFGNYAIHDQSEPALHLTRALFTPNAPYSDVVTFSGPMEAQRTGGPVLTGYYSAPLETIASDGSFNLNGSVFMQAAAPGSSTQIPLTGPGVQSGTLIGVRPMALNPARYSMQVNAHDFSTPIKIHQSAGGGILGTMSYLLLNLGRPDANPSDGGLRVPRRWAEAVFHDLLDRRIPTIRTSDATLYVQPNTTTKTPPFRSSRNCMSCHASLDQMAYTARAYSYVPVPAYGDVPTSGRNIQLAAWPTTQPRETGYVDSDPNFMRRPPNGELIFRDYQGKLVAENVQGVDGLGQAIADLDDLYIAAAARYFWYFTGIAVTIQDPGDPANPPLSVQDQAYLNLVIQLGKHLHQTQSLRTLIQDILSLPLYRTNSMR